MTIMRSLNDLAGGFFAALIGLPQAIILGIVVFSPLGTADAIQMGIAAGIIAVVAGGLVAAFVGGMPLLITGPRASASLILASLVKELTELLPSANSTESNLLSWLFLCVLVAGVMQIAMATMRLDRLIRRIPDPVSSTFTLIIGIIIVLDQLPPLLTGHYASRPTLFQLPHLVIQAQPAAALVGTLTLLCIAALAFIPSLRNRSIPLGTQRLSMANIAPLLGLALGMVLFQSISAIGLQGQGDVLGKAANFATVNRYFSHIFTLFPAWNEQTAITVGIHSMLLALMGALDTMIAGNALESKFDVPNNSRRELFGQGIANVISAALGGIAVIGSLQRGQASAELGGRTARAGIASALFILAMVTIGWPWVSQLAIGVLAAMLAFTGLQMITANFHFRREWRLTADNQRREEGITNLLTITVMLVSSLLIGAKLMWVTLAGLCITISGLLYKLSNKPVFRVYTHKQRRSTELRSLQNRQRLDESPHEIRIMELSGDLIFASAAELQERIAQEYGGSKTPAPEHCKRYLILDFSRVHEMDDTGTRALAKCISRLAQQGIDIRLSYICDEGACAYRLAQLTRIDFAMICPRAHWYEDTDHALEAVEDEILREHALEWQRELSFAELPFCVGLSEDEITILENSFEAPVTVERDKWIFKQGDPADSLYVLRSGDVKLQTSSSTDSVKRIAQLNPGAIFGSDSILGDNRRRVATAIAREASTYTRISCHNLTALTESRPDLALRIYQSAAQEFADRISMLAREAEMVDA